MQGTDSGSFPVVWQGSAGGVRGGNQCVRATLGGGSLSLSGRLGPGDNVNLGGLGLWGIVNCDLDISVTKDFSKESLNAVPFQTIQTAAKAGDC